MRGLGYPQRLWTLWRMASQTCCRCEGAKRCLGVVGGMVALSPPPQTTLPQPFCVPPHPLLPCGGATSPPRPQIWQHVNQRLPDLVDHLIVGCSPAEPDPEVSARGVQPD